MKEEKPAVNLVSSEYGFRASTMRCKIEEKISEIEEKIKLPNTDSSSESLDIETRYLNHYCIVGKLFCLHLLFYCTGYPYNNFACLDVSVA